VRKSLDDAVLEWMHEPQWKEDDERFGELALALFAHQFTWCEPYRRFCEGRGRTPDRVESWRQIPPVPTGAFKEVALRSFPPEREVHTFRTSGTTTASRGELHLDTLALYEASLLAAFWRHVLPDVAAPDPEAKILVLAPSPAEARDSSLSHMFGVAIRELGAEGSGFFVESDALDTDRLLGALEKPSRDVPLALCGTAFAFVHLLDELERRQRRLALPESARIMETGGFKGRSRALSRPELYRRLEEGLGVPVERIVNQYGMTELGSQFYDSVLREPAAARRKLSPPWARVRIVDAETGGDAAPDASGTIVVYDLANTGSVIAIQTADVGRRVKDGFEVIGREPGAEERGCSIATDEILTGAQR
jgi:acyl-CoA synthetase (AMP-forming)/AMP-acid ligase II